MSWWSANRTHRGSISTPNPPQPNSPISRGVDLRPIVEATKTTLHRAQDQWRTLFSSNLDTSPKETEFTATLSSANCKSNNAWGDDMIAKDHGITRVYVANVNGLQLDPKGGKFDSICRAIKEVQSDVFCGQEHNVDTTQTSLRNIVFDTAGQHWERHRIAIGTSPIPFKTPFKPGGTMILTVDSLTGTRLCKQEKDKWGRWTSHIYQGQAERKLVVLSVYQPIVKGGEVGKITKKMQNELYRFTRCRYFLKDALGTRPRLVSKIKTAEGFWIREAESRVGGQ